MPKMKSHRGTAARFERTKTGKLRRRHAKLNHILEKKSPAQKRRLGQETAVAPGDFKRIKKLLGL